MKFSTSDEVTALLNAAQAAAIKAMDGAPVTPAALAQLAARVKAAILTAVAVGKWAGIGVRDPDDFVDLKVEAALGNTLLGEPPIKVLYDFTQTAKPLLQVQSVRKTST